MKFSLKQAMASVLISSSMIIPMAMPIHAESTSTTPITEVKIETPEDFIKYCLSNKKIVDNKTVYEAFKAVDDTNYQTILDSETTYQELAKDDTKKEAIDALIKKNTENAYPTYDSLLKAAKDKDAAIKAQQEAEKKKQEEEATQENLSTSKETSSPSSTPTHLTSNEALSQSTTQTHSPSNETTSLSSPPTSEGTSQPSASSSQETTTDSQPETNRSNETENRSNATTNPSSSTKQEENTATKQDEQATVVENTQPLLNTQTVVFTGCANHVKVTVYAQAGAFEQGTQMVVIPLDTQSALADAKAVLGENVDQAISVDISFWKDGKEVEPRKAVEVKLSTDQFDAGTNVSVIHDSGDGDVKSVGTSDNATEVTISTSAFSPYTIASEKVIEPVVVQAQTSTSLSTTTQKVTPTTTTPTATNISEQAFNVVIKEKTSASTTAQAFVNTYLTSSTGVVYERANYTNYQRILSSKSAWDRLSASEKIQVNSILTKRIQKTYTKLYNEAKAMDVPTNVNTAVASQYVSYTVLCGMAIIGMISVRKKIKSE